MSGAEGTKSDGGTSGRKSVGNASSSESGEKVLPHYLRASTGSCHDFCKYGKKHAFEAKGRPRIAKSNRKPSIDNQSPTASMILPERKKTLVARPKSSPIPKTYSSDIPEIIKHEGEVLSGIKRTSASKLRPSPTSKSRLSESPQNSMGRNCPPSAKTEVSSIPIKSKSKEKNAASKHASSLKAKSLVQKPLSSPDISGGLSGRRNSDIKTGPPKVAVKKVIASPRLSLASPRASLSPKPSISRVAKKASPRASLSPKPSISRVAKKVLVSPRVSLASPRASLSPRPSLNRVASLNARKHKSLKVVSPMKNQGQTKTDEPKESKLLPPSCSLAESLPGSSSSSLHNEEQQEISEYTETGTEDDFLSESDEPFSTEEEETMENEHPGRSRKDGMVYSEEKGSQAMKLHFRKGKVVDIQSDNNGPRRLKFRRGRVLGEKPNLKGDGRRSFKKRGTDGVVIDSKSSSQKVVLRHQDVQGKKDSQILFNNVIEQTASKLAEIRKSKVKALVGAFETVISLQDTKPSANTVA
ncbi:hypothetical protein Patl1_21817 [Pistacia atlantica]|uniref:Uncharacterized protein n=1 Tax=Pistacia atlantica TaxID=434234 RepID=A0ACC1BMC9_9ROSI|nr:hypothetical protein Patl1_21817 [Pistacia atlantica]